MFLYPSADGFSLCKKTSVWLVLRNDFPSHQKTYKLINCLIFDYADCTVLTRALPLKPVSLQKGQTLQKAIHPITQVDKH